MGGGSACRPHVRSSSASSGSDVTGWRRNPLSTSSPQFAAILPQFLSQVPSLVLSSTSNAQPTRAVSRVVGCVGGSMLFKVALVLLATWLVGVLFVSRAGQAVHVLLLVGLTLLLLAVLRAREEAMRRTVEGHVDKK